MNSDDLLSLLAEVVQGIGPEKSTLPDTPEVRAKRARLAKQVAAIKAKGLVPDVGMEWPSIPKK
jgi:hypothetical protein